MTYIAIMPKFLRRFIKFLFSFETFTVLWLFSYQYKNAYDIFSSPDITLLLTLLLIPWALFLFYKHKSRAGFRDGPVLLFLVMSLWFITTSFWSPSHAYKLQKTLCYSIYTIPGFLMAYFIISQDQARLKRLMGAFFVFSILVLGETFRVFWNNGLTIFSDILNTNYLVTGQTLGVGLLVLIPSSYFIFIKNSGENEKLTGRFPLENKEFSCFYGAWFWFLLLNSLFFYALIHLGGRGPVVASSTALALFYGVKSWQDAPSKTGIHFGILALLCGLSYLILNGFFEHTGSHFEHRIAPLLTGQIDEALIERFTYYQSAFHAFLQHPLAGVGLGGWPIFQGLGDVSLHPHNIFLEILSETGFIGFVTFMAFLSSVLKNLKINFVFSTPELTSLILITLFSFINAQKTGDLHDNLLLFFSLALCAGLKNWKSDNVHYGL